jgi:hypothetical protein
MLQLNPQVLLAHVAVAFGAAGQALPHPPQWDTWVDVFASQPFPKSPSQSANGALQLNSHEFESQIGVEFGAVEQMLPQKPQLSGSVAGVDSQPSAMLPLQLAEPALHTAMQLPAEQTGVAEG